MEIQEPLKIVIVPENRREFQDVYIICRTYIDMSKSIPSSIVHRLFELMYGQQEYELNKRFEQVKFCSDQAVAKIENMKGYHFNWQDTDPFNVGGVMPIDTKQVFEILVSAFFSYKDDHPRTGKDETIAFFYWAFDDQYKMRMKPEDQESFSPYKQAVISGILTMAVGFQLTNKHEITNEEIFQATRNAIKKYKSTKDLAI